MIFIDRRSILTLLALLVACALVTECGGSKTSTRRYPLTGKILSVDQTKQQIVVSHAEIPGYMPAMVMPFKLQDPSALATLAKGDVITATLSVDKQESFLMDLHVVRRDADSRDIEIGKLPHEGDEVPNFTLTNQSGNKISISQFRGRALLITFIYTRCPLPDYCPLMSSNFAAIDQALRKDPNLYARTHLLSVSFDANYDTPAVLKSYGAAYTEKYSDEKFDHWEFASGSAEEVKAITKFFGLQYEAKSGQIVHSLVTAIVSPDGKVQKIYPFNDWKPAEVLSELHAMKL